MELGGEVHSLIKVMAYVSISMTYARFTSSATKPGALRLLSLFPVISLLPFLPFSFSSLHLRAISAFFLVWLAIFKLLLLSFDVGPLSPSLPLSTFIATSSLPVKLNPSLKSKSSSSSSNNNKILPFCIKTILLFFIISQYEHQRPKLPRYALLTIYCIHVYLALEIVLTVAGFLASALLGLRIEPQFDAPFKSTSLQDFWGRRWNLMVTGILRPSVYHPIKARFGAMWGVMAVFLVSGLMHEVVFYYITLEGPTGEVTLFFLIQGVALGLEIWGKRRGWWRPPAVVGTAATLGFVAGTGFCLFFPPVLRGGAEETTMKECEEMWRFLREILLFITVLPLGGWE